jgi:uncharacterized protein with NAD-binding domain and iron-sulfur cluster
LLSCTIILTGCDYFKSPFEQQIDRQNYAQENAQDMADQMMDNIQSFNQFMPNINSSNVEQTTEIFSTQP